MMYGSWDMEHNRQNFCHFGPFFALYPPKQPKKSKFWKIQKSLETLSFYMFMIPFFALYLHNNPKNKIFWKNLKKQ